MLRIVKIWFVVYTLLSVESNNEFVSKLLAKMTIEDKCGQMNQITLDSIVKCSPSCQSSQDDGTPFYCSCPPNDIVKNPLNITRLEEAVRKFKVGSILNIAYDRAFNAEIWQQIIESIQIESLKNPLKIPILYGLDSIHGANYIEQATLMPQPLAMASSFNLDIVKRVAKITAMETRAIGVAWNFNPILDIGRQHLWPRLYETYGEDVYLATKIGKTYIKSSQGASIKNRTKVATCLKHYIGYSYPLNGKDRTEAWIPDSILREYFLPTFAAGVKAGAQTVMINSAVVNGIPGHVNSYYINEILKGELNFTGFVVSDWEDVIRLHVRDKVASSPEEAVRIAVMSGIDMSMVPFGFNFFQHCVNLANKDEKFLSRVNNAVERILKVKDKIGLFDQNGRASLPVKDDLKNINKSKSFKFNLEAARETIILAKNEQSFLPLSKDKKILVVGTSGNKLRVLNGGWSYKWQGNNEAYFKKFANSSLTIFEAIKRKTFGKDPVYVEGANFTNVIDLDLAVEEAIKAEVILLCIGEETYAESEGNINNLFLDEPQQILANALIELNKEIVLIYLGGRPRIITNIVENKNVKSVLLSFLPGNRGAEAIADILFGDYNPNARLPITYPRNPNGQTPYDVRPLEKYEYLFPFGHGLSYTRFEYSDLKLSSKEVDFKRGVQVTVRVKNIGNRDGKETVILYLNDAFASVSRPTKQMKGFKKIFLKTNKQKMVTFKLLPYDFTFINEKGKRVAENGLFNVFIANLSDSFELKNASKSFSNSSNFYFG